MLESRQNKLRKHYIPMQHSAQGVAQNYSISTYNSTELAKDIIRHNIDKVLLSFLIVRFLNIFYSSCNTNAAC